MSSNPNQVYSDLVETKKFLNISNTFSASDDKVNVARNMADNYVNTQINLHNLIPLTSPDPELTSLASALAASQYNYFQSPSKGDLVKDVKAWEKRVQDYILATFGKKNPNMLAGGTVFGSTSAMSGRTK